MFMQLARYAKTYASVPSPHQIGLYVGIYPSPYLIFEYNTLVQILLIVVSFWEYSLSIVV